MHNKINPINYSKYYSVDETKQFYKFDSYFYGLSLSVSDKKEIKEIYNNSNKMYIYYKDDEDYNSKIKNLSIILGRTKLKNEKDIKIFFVNID